MKHQKCEECKESIPEGMEKYVKGKIVCDRCYFRLRKNGQNRQEVESVYLKWLSRE